jgi:hypothetical protein
MQNLLKRKHVEEEDNSDEEDLSELPKEELLAFIEELRKENKRLKERVSYLLNRN